jgi:nucleoside 2-deoxyribosyltransferase
LRADDKSYDQDLKINIEAYLHGSKIAIALYERISSDLFNPNVAFEVGYMIGLKKDVCLLKEKTLKYINTDLIGNLYSEFDVQDIEGTIPVQVERWLKEKEIID